MEAPLKRNLPPKVNPYLYGVGILVIFMGLILGAQLLGLWSTSGRLTPSGAPVQITGNDPAEIKGWTKLEDISNTYKIPLTDILAAFKLPADTPGNLEIKNLEGQGENFSVITLRAWLVQKLGTSLTATTPETNSGNMPKSRTGNKTPEASPPAKS